MPTIRRSGSLNGELRKERGAKKDIEERTVRFAVRIIRLSQTIDWAI
ncbi:MAG: hypothetical protein NT106_13420 [Candidatus Sumerlaeota bacterium]|nr:hypothetical protein [Candidatus Sumerlaeota bacterium]